MISGDAHFSIDGVLFKAAVDEDVHYNHNFESLFAPTQAIAGEVAKDNIRPEKIIWSITDWIGGEGATVYYPQNSTQYDVGSLVNVTKRGQLTTRTKRRRSSVARAGTNADTSSQPMGASAYTHAVIGWEDNIIVSSDAISWSASQDTSPAMSGASFADAISDGTNAAFLAASGGAADAIPVVEVDSSTTTWADMHSGTLVDPPIVGAVLDGVPYTYGLDSTLKVNKKAAVMDSSADWGATVVYNTQIAPVGTWGTNYWTSAVAAETALYVSYSTKTHCFVWEIRNDVGRPFWTGDPGFAGKKLIYKSGILFVLGNTHAAGSTFATIQAIPLSTNTPLIVSEPRKHQNTNFADFNAGCAGNGDYIFAADGSVGKIFLYDIRNDATSLFDDLANGGSGDGTSFVAGTDYLAFLAMHGARLFGATFTASAGGPHGGGGGGTSLQVISWDDLEVQNRDSSQSVTGTLETATWDFGLPMETKRLDRFIVNFKVTDSGTTSGLVANSRIKISYAADDASYTDLTTITSATTPSGVKGRVVLTAPTGASTVLFSRLKVKITLDNNSQAVAPPVLFSVMVEAEPAAYEETWTLALRMEDETFNERPTARQETQASVVARLNTLKTQKRIIPFLDGFVDKANNSYTSHTVVIDDVSHDLRGDGVGITRLKLRAIQS